MDDDYLEILWRRKRLIALGVLAGLLAVLIIGRPSPRPPSATYSATQVLVADPEDRSAVGLYETLATQSEVPARVAAALGSEDTAQAIAERVDVTSDPERGLVLLTVEGEQFSERAAELVDAYGAELVAYVDGDARDDLAREISLAEAREAAIAAQIDEIEARLSVSPQAADIQTEMETALTQFQAIALDLAELRFQEASGDPVLESIGPAQTVETLEGGFDDPLGFAGRLLVGVAVGAVLAVGLSFLLHRFDTRIYSRHDAEEAFGQPVLAEIPRFQRKWRNRRSIVTDEQPGSLASESYRSLRTTISALHKQRTSARARDGIDFLPSRAPSESLVLLVASPGPGEGKSTTTANLASAFADADQSVLVVSGDLRWPTIHEYLDAPGEPGLSDAVLDSEHPTLLPQIVQPTSLAGVDLLPHGRYIDNPGETLAASRSLILSGREHYDVVLIDSPPLLLGNDVSELVPVANGMVLVARVGKTDAERAQRSREVVDRLVAPVLGVVLVGSDQAFRRHGHYRPYARPDRTRGVAQASPWDRLTSWIRGDSIAGSQEVHPVSTAADTLVKEIAEQHSPEEAGAVAMADRPGGGHTPDASSDGHTEADPVSNDRPRGSRASRRGNHANRGADAGPQKDG